MSTTFNCCDQCKKVCQREDLTHFKSMTGESYRLCAHCFHKERAILKRINSGQIQNVERRLGPILIDVQIYAREAILEYLENHDDLILVEQVKVRIKKGKEQT